MDIEIHPGNILFHTPGEVGVNFVPQAERVDGLMKNALFHAEVTQGCDGHVAADSRETIEVKDAHRERDYRRVR
jgi:hypothetical protein